jgi:hypothetical protein
LREYVPHYGSHRRGTRFVVAMDRATKRSFAPRAELMLRSHGGSPNLYGEGPQLARHAARN